MGIAEDKSNESNDSAIDHGHTVLKESATHKPLPLFRVRIRVIDGFNGPAFKVRIWERFEGLAHEVQSPSSFILEWDALPVLAAAFNDELAKHSKGGLFPTFTTEDDGGSDE